MIAYKTPSIDVLKRHTISSLIGSALQAPPTQVGGTLATEREEKMEEGENEDTVMFLEEDSLREDEAMVVGTEPVEEGGETNLDFDHLVHRCIHGAASMVKDQVDTGSSTTRITKLFTLFSLGKEKGGLYLHLSFICNALRHE